MERKNVRLKDETITLKVLNPNVREKLLSIELNGYFDIHTLRDDDVTIQSIHEEVPYCETEYLTLSIPCGITYIEIGGSGNIGVQIQSDSGLELI